LTALLLAAFLAAAPADTLVVGTLADPASLEPHLATDIVAAEIVASVCETLVRVRPGSLRPEGVLATTWASSDQRVWTFTLRQNVRFQDGAPLDADAVVGNFEHLRLKRAFPGRAERVGPHLVQITLDRPNAALLATLSQPFFAMQSPRRLAGPGSEQPVGTGPFRLDAARPGRVDLSAFDGHWAGAPRLRRLVFRRFADETGYKSEAEKDGLGGWGYDAARGKCRGRDLKFNWRNPGFPQTDDQPVVDGDRVHPCSVISCQG